MVVNVVNSGLIQSVRLVQAVAEAGFTVQVPHKMVPAYRHLQNHFPFRITMKQGKLIDAEISHKDPFCRVGGIKRPLIFPRAITDRCKVMWQNDRSGIRFRGFFPEKREASLQAWQDKAIIEPTEAGRKGVQRYWDESYKANLAAAEFALCPNGGYPWSYRVIEACLLGATPIIQTPCPWYEGMYYCKWNEPLERKNVEENYEWAVNLITVSKEEMVEAVTASTK